jgi:AraC-like DNA-binding protein
MDHLSDWFFSMVFFAGVLGFLVAAILVFVNKTDTFPSRILAGFLVCFSLLALNYALMTTRFYLRYPQLWRAVGWASFCYAPLAYLYVRSVLRQSYRFYKTDILFFIPALIHPLALIPFFILPEDQKIAFLHKVNDNPKLITLEPESLLPEGFSILLRVVVGVVAVTAQFVILGKWKRKHSKDFLKELQNRNTFRWLYRFTIVMALSWALIILQLIFHFTGSVNLNYPIILTLSGTISFISLYLLLQPSILYGMMGWLPQIKPVASLGGEEGESPKQTQPEIRKTGLSADQGRIMKSKLEVHFDTNHPFRKTGYTITDLSKELDIPSYQLSSFINQEYGRNFNELINEYRVDYLIQQFEQSVDFSNYTLEAFGKEAGFNSRAAFISAVKKRTGKTPSELFGRRGEKA